MGLPARNMAVATPYAFGGGLDQASSGLAVPGGRVIAAMNYEPVVDGYARVQGHERFDGRLPSQADYWSMAFKNGTVSPPGGATVTGLTSGATAKLLYTPGAFGTADLQGSFGSGTATGTLLLANVVGTFVANETLKYGTSTNFAVVQSAPVKNDAPTVDMREGGQSSAQYTLRNSIQLVPGSGPVRGGFVFNGVAYAIRDNAAGTQGIIYKATSSGWVAQSFGRVIFFKLGLVEIAEGSTITGATSGATAKVERVIVQSGAWGATLDADKAYGYLVLSGQTGAFASGEVLKVGATNSATNNQGGDSAQIILPAGGRYHCKVKNFYGATNRKRVYCASGVWNAIEYDGGSVLVPIITGMATDTPTRVFDIANALGLCFPGGSVQISEPGEPCVFNAILGALEIALGDDITDVVSANDSAVVFFCNEKVASLTGRGVDTFVLEQITDEAGALPWTTQRIGLTVYLDRRGLRDLQATAAFGDFKAGSMSELFAPFLDAKRRAGATPTASIRCKTKTQYRCYYSDGTGFTVYMEGKAPSMLPFTTDTMRVYATFRGEMTDGSEGMFACDTSGYVFRLDSGTSFDGQQINAFLMTPFNHLGNVGINKRFHGVSVELTGSARTRLGLTAQFDYGDGEQPISGDKAITTNGNSSFIAVHGGGGDFIATSGGGSFDPTKWDQFYWASGSSFQGMAEADIGGAGRNVSIIFGCRSQDIEPPHTLQAYTVRWSPRGQVKRTAQ